MPQKDLREFIEDRRHNVHPRLRNQKRGAVLEIIEDSELSVDDLAQCLLNSDVRLQSITQAVLLFTDAIRSKFIIGADPDFLFQSKQELYEMGLKKNIQFTPHVRNKINSEKQWFRTGCLLDTRGLDKIEQIKQKLVWMDCLSDFFFQTHLFDRDSTIKDMSQQAEKSGEEANATVVNHMPEHEDIILQLLRSGFLQCDLGK